MTEPGDAHPMAGQPSSGPDYNVPGYNVMVLLVDDQAMIGEAMRRALAGQPNISFHYCSDPHEAIRVAEEVKPTVILQDLVMPGIDGLTLLRRYRANPAIKDIPVIVLSTKEDSKIKSLAFAEGATDYLVKLPDDVELIARIRHHSKAYLNQLQRDEAYRALRQSQQELLEKNIELQRLTSLDGLTGLSNRRYLDEFITMQWKHAIREQHPMSILMIDVDDFKRYNDSYGHLAGDEVLKQVGAAIMKCCERPTDLAARFGGEEFVVILPMSPLDGAQAFGEKLRHNVQELAIAHRNSTVSDRITVSVGGASTIPQRGDSVLLLIGAADISLYEAKHAGKNQVVIREPVRSAPGDSGR